MVASVLVFRNPVSVQAGIGSAIGISGVLFYSLVKQHYEKLEQIAEEEEAKQLFHLTTIFSTTMWIHVHSGDIGLKSFLERACLCTRRYLLIEPQPSGW